MCGSSMATLLPYPSSQERLRLVVLRPDLSISLLFHGYTLTLYAVFIVDNYHKFPHILHYSHVPCYILTTFITHTILSQHIA